MYNCPNKPGYVGLGGQVSQKAGTIQVSECSYILFENKRGGGKKRKEIDNIGRKCK